MTATVQVKIHMSISLVIKELQKGITLIITIALKKLQHESYATIIILSVSYTKQRNFIALNPRQFHEDHTIRN